MRYPRDLQGYGAVPPHPRWPRDARIAVQFVINYEEGGENAVVHGDAASEAFLSDIAGAEPWPGQRHWNMESLYEYGARAGFWRLHRMFVRHGIPVTIYGVATALARSPVQVAAMQEAGWEIASHGLKWIEYRGFSRDEEREHIRRAIQLHEQVTGERPRGWYTGRCSANTVELVASEGGFDYISDAYADDLPYWIRAGGRDQLVIPYTLDANDMRFAVAQGFGSGDEFFAYLRDSFDTLYAEGCEGQPRMLSVGLHCRLAGRPGRAAALKRFIEHASGHAHVWFARRIDIAHHWQRAHPPRQARVRPSTLDRTGFVEMFGGVFEHSPWIADRAWHGELGPAHDTPEGLHSALSRVFRSAGAEERLGVLRAHPDLAGRLAAARRLTPSSQAEQASAGLDALTDGERARFQELNRTYVERHGFPFIIAVRDHDRAGILRAFETRIDNDRDTEIREACRQVERIAGLRIHEILEPEAP